MFLPRQSRRDLLVQRLCPVILSGEGGDVEQLVWVARVVGPAVEVRAGAAAAGVHHHRVVGDGAKGGGGGGGEAAQLVCPGWVKGYETCTV